MSTPVYEAFSSQSVRPRYCYFEAARSRPWSQSNFDQDVRLGVLCVIFFNEALFGPSLLQ